MNSPAQHTYQVRFDWGVAGAASIAEGADAIVWVDQLAAPSASVPPVGMVPVVVAGGIRNAAAVAGWVLERQGEAGDRFTVAVVAAGETRADGSLRFAVEDLLGAGAVIDALAARGIDFSSPEAAAACAAYTGLRMAAGHLISASVSGKEGGIRLPDLSATDDVPVLG